MIEDDIKSNWYYYCALVRQLQQTEQFVDHSVGYDGEFANGKTFSNEFAKILMLSASEFEVVCKSLCKEIRNDFNLKSSIVKISKEILSAFPLIGNTIITTPYKRYKPLANWKVAIKTDENGASSECVEGIDWWKNYNDVKHNRRSAFQLANLKNCIDATASLLIVEMYLSQKSIGNIKFITETGCEYFSTDFEPSHFVAHNRKRLPDFEDRSDASKGGTAEGNKKNNEIWFGTQEEFDKKIEKEGLPNGDLAFVYE